MVDAWIIEELERQEEKEKEEMPFLELPLYEGSVPTDEVEVESSNRGVLTIQIWGDEEEEE
jgi:hypothetical protein